MKILEKGHVTDVGLEDYALNHLAEPELETVEEHILICPACQDRLAEVDDFVKAFRVAHERMANAPASSPPPTSAPVAPNKPKRHDFAIVDLPSVASDSDRAWEPAAPIWFQRPVAWVGLAVAIGVVTSAPLWWGRQTPPPPIEPQPVFLVAQRGATPNTGAQPGRLALTMDLRGISDTQLSVSIARWDGRTVWQQTMSLAQASGRIEPSVFLAPGQYWVRVQSATGTPTLLREFGLRLAGR